jgi:iron(III) transport system permease protein
MGCLTAHRWFRVAGRITLPLISTGILSGFFISFILAMGDLGVTLLVVPPGSATLPVKIFNFMHYGAEAMVAALCLIQLSLQLLVSVGLLGLHRWLARVQKGSA